VVAASLTRIWLQHLLFVHLLFVGFASVRLRGAPKLIVSAAGIVPPPAAGKRGGLEGGGAGGLRAVGAGRTRTSHRRIMSLTASVLTRPCSAAWCSPVQVGRLSWGLSCCPVLSRAFPFGSTAGSTGGQVGLKGPSSFDAG
jgi:hypothetical protein